MQKFCLRCGKELRGDEMSCPECGAPTDNVPVDSPQYQRYVRSRGSTPNWMPAAFMILIIIVAAACGIFFLADNQTPASDDRSITYQWDYKFDNGDVQNYSFTLTVKNADYDAMKKSTINKSGTTASDMYKTTDGKTVFGVKDYVVVDNYVKTVKSNLEKLYKDTKPSGATDDLASFISGFTQKTISYDHEEETNKTDYWRYPLETLIDKKGDCEDTAILNTALLYAKADDTSTVYEAGIFLLPEHAVSAVSKASVEPKVYTNERLGYYPIETAVDGTQYGIGTLSEKYLGAYFHLYTGYVTTYYQ